MTTDTPGVDLDAARLLANRATGSPWSLTERQSNGRRVLIIVAEGHGEVHDDAMVAELPMQPGDDEADWRNDGEFIAKSRSLVPALVDIAENARYVVGAQPCVEGECEHAAEVDENAPDDAPCPLLETRYATADELIKLREELALLRPVVDAAAEWVKFPTTLGSTAEALENAVKALPNMQEPWDICSGYGCPDCRNEQAEVTR